MVRDPIACFPLITRNSRPDLDAAVFKPPDRPPSLPLKYLQIGKFCCRLGAQSTAGLFYVLHPRPVPRAQAVPFRADPATIVFVRRAALP